LKQQRIAPLPSPHWVDPSTPLYVALSQQSASEAHVKAVMYGNAQHVPTGEPPT